jgi:hypothetical protein
MPKLDAGMSYELPVLGESGALAAGDIRLQGGAFGDTVALRVFLTDIGLRKPSCFPSSFPVAFI